MNTIENTAKKNKLAVIDWLIEHFPQTFFKNSKYTKPLQIGIYDDLVDFYERLEHAPFSKKSLRDALNYYSSSPAYLNCQKSQTARVDIYGNEVDLVTEEQAKYAWQRYQDRYSKNAKQLKNKQEPEDKI